MGNTNEIVSKFKNIHEILLETTQIINTFLQNENLPHLKVERLKKINIKYNYDYYLKIIAPIQNDKQLINNITNAIFFNLWDLSMTFFDISYLKRNDKKFNNYKEKIIQIGIDIDFYLDAIECLRYNLKNLYNFFITYGVAISNEYYLERYGISLNYNCLLINSLKEKDFIKRKELFLKELHKAELYKLQEDIEKEDLVDFENFISKCYNAIESIDFQIISSKASEVKHTEENELQIKSEELKKNLYKYGFKNLETTKTLTPNQINSLIVLILKNGIPYSLAMFDFLGFLNHLSKEQLMTQAKIYDTIGKILDINARTIKGNICVLSNYSKENKERYTSHLHKDTVIRDYNQLK